jgi:SAM-dependent methyltransferase
MANIKYTELWTNKFSVEEVKKYDDKFKNKWNKNIKHRQQIVILKRHLKPENFWCDMPIGSGRINDDMKHLNFLGCDISDFFLQHNIAKGYTCEKVDIYDFGKLKSNQFDVVTTFNTIFAFSDFEKILDSQLLSLKKNGIFLVDIPNKLHSNKYKTTQIKLASESEFYPVGMTRSEIESFFTSRNCKVLEIIAHDFWDNFPISYFWKSGSRPIKGIKHIIWSILNFIYFKMHLFFIFNYIEKFFKDEYFTKYMVIVKKNNE